VVEVYQAPSPQGYQRAARFGRGDRLAPQAFLDLVLMVDEIL
jgi:Uma2 family endonuclease